MSLTATSLAAVPTRGRRPGSFAGGRRGRCDAGRVAPCSATIGAFFGATILGATARRHLQSRTHRDQPLRRISSADQKGTQTVRDADDPVDSTEGRPIQALKHLSKVGGAVVEPQVGVDGHEEARPAAQAAERQAHRQIRAHAVGVHDVPAGRGFGVGRFGAARSGGRGSGGEKAPQGPQDSGISRPGHGEYGDRQPPAPGFVGEATIAQAEKVHIAARPLESRQQRQQMAHGSAGVAAPDDVQDVEPVLMLRPDGRRDGPAAGRRRLPRLQHRRRRASPARNQNPTPTTRVSHTLAVTLATATAMKPPNTPAVSARQKGSWRHPVTL